jgi:hypothetical protein
MEQNPKKKTWRETGERKEDLRRKYYHKIDTSRAVAMNRVEIIVS